MRNYIDTLQDVNGNALVGATVLVQNLIGGGNASIFSDNGLTPISTSTVVTGADGQFSFFAADGDYTLTMSKNATVLKVQSPVVLFDGAAQVTFADGGTANTYATTNSALEKALRPGLRAAFTAANSNTGASTYQYNSLAVKNLLLPGGGTLPAGSILANGIYQVEYDGTEWQLRVVTSANVYPVTGQESGASVVPVNLSSPSAAIIGGGNVLRYENNTVPGTTDMSQGFINAQASNTTFSVPPGSYLSNTALSGTYSYIAQGNPTFSGANPLGAWIPPFGGTFQVVTTGNQNGFVSALLNNLASNSVAEPCAITAYARNNNPQNLAFAMFARADNMAVSGCVTSELNTFNLSATPATLGAYPPNRSFGTTQQVPVCLTVAAGGTQSSHIGIQITQEGSQPQKFNTGIYVNWTTCNEYGIFIDALLNDICSPALIKHSAAQVGVQVNTQGGIFGVAIAGTAGQFTCAATNLIAGMRVRISGALTGSGSITGYSNFTDYAMSATNGSTTFTLQTLTGGAIVTTAGTTTGLNFAALLVGGASILYQDSNGVNQFKVSQFGQVSANQGQAMPAGGAQAIGYLISSAANFGVFCGSGAPTLTAAQGSLYLRSDGSSTTTRLYVNTTGSSVWTNVATAA